jgi:hypothetical protein
MRHLVGAAITTITDNTRLADIELKLLKLNNTWSQGNIAGDKSLGTR